MNYAFHDIKHIVQPYLNDLPAHSRKRTDHPQHLRAIFLRCRHYKIRLNPHKCVFCVGFGRLLGFVVSKNGIRLDPIKVQAILDMPPPFNLLQIQRLQGKANFLRRFIPNYVELAKGYTCLLKKWVPFHWDQVVQSSFDALKDSLIKSSLMYAPNYQKYFYLYLVVADTTISMVLVQENDGIEHLINYLSRNLNDTESKYSYIEKLALAAIQAVQRFCHYILLSKTTIVSDCNPMTYILSRQLLGGKYSKWIVILQEFYLEFIKSKPKKSLIFAKLLYDLPSSSNDLTSEASIMDEYLFLISSSDPWYGDILVYLQTQAFRPNTSRSEQRRIRYQAKDYLIVGDTLYRCGVDMILRRCLTHEEAEKALNECHSGACGLHLSGYATAQKILRAGYF